MQLFLITKSKNKSLSFSLGPTSLCVCLTIAVVSGFGIFNAGVNYMMDSTRGSFKTLYAQTAPVWSKEIEVQQRTLNELQKNAENSLDALATKLSKLQARVMRLDALGSRLADFVDFNDIDFDISVSPGLGGREPKDPLVSMQVEDFVAALEELNYKIQDRAEKLAAMESMLIDRTIQNQIPSGFPTEDGWISSTYGRRLDPISGKMQFHEGVDFAGRAGSSIETVASGLVTWSGYRYGYGNMVEINHGNGYQTRYAHHKKNLVVVGQKVDKGQVIALMGDTGRATGPHVHFEVVKNGTSINPIQYTSSKK
jgi:murein DD-endopeptidase MepM/ murein hydrolase activator NlpD